MNARMGVYVGIAIMWIGILLGWLLHLPQYVVTITLAVGAVTALVCVIRFRRQGPPR